MWSRRTLLTGFASLAALSAWGPAWASTEGPIFVLLQLRGGWDGLAVVPAFGDPTFARARGRLAAAPPAVEDLDGFFGLHPALAPLVPWYREGSLLPIHAVATAFTGRSHFDAQEVLESGGAAPGEHRDGWMNRLAGQIPGATAVALGASTPLVLRGAHPAQALNPLREGAAHASVFDDLEVLYARDPDLLAALRAGRDSVELLGTEEGRGGRDSRAIEAGARVALDARGPVVLALDIGGWDTHAGQEGQLAARLRGLAAGLVGLRRALGPAWSRTVVAVVSEFGRTVATNGTAGSDHGRGTVALLAGGRVAGGRVLADWPGLRPEDLWEGRDLRPTRDLHAMLAGAVRSHLGADNLTTVFPGVKPMDGLLRV
jgi:uncharacterized protein (DUF1501 family)